MKKKNIPEKLLNKLKYVINNYFLNLFGNNTSYEYIISVLQTISNMNILLDNEKKTNIIVDVSNIVVDKQYCNSVTFSLIIKFTYDGVRKFVDSLPLIDISNNLGKYLPLAIPQKSPLYPESEDYYEIALVEFTTQFHSDLKQDTKVRGYVQVNINGDDSTNIFEQNGNIIDCKLKNLISNTQYMGVIFDTSNNKPIRIKVYNLLPNNTDLFIPCETTYIDDDKQSQNKSIIHLHGGSVPYISDGISNAWTTAINEYTKNPNGISKQDSYDVDNQGQGIVTHYYTNQCSSRMLWYHDNSLDKTRLNVYVGEKSIFMIRDEIEQNLINHNTIPTDEIPLIIEDKCFVPDDYLLSIQDPTWFKGKDKFNWGTEGELWFPHVYTTKQNPNLDSGSNLFGRWNYGPWFDNVKVNNLPYVDSLGREYPSLPNPSKVPVTFFDTPVINGIAYPYLEVNQKAYRFRILNASNDRTFNLSIHKAKSNIFSSMIDNNGNIVDLHLDSGEINIINAFPQDENYPESWPIDNREGGVPDPTKIGPYMIQIGNECGFLPKEIVWKNTPINYKLEDTFQSVSRSNVFLIPGMRADIIIDFTNTEPDDVFILYNDYQAGFDKRNDPYTNSKDLTSVGGLPSLLPGYGSNMRTIMQFRIKNIESTYLESTTQINLDTLSDELSKAYYNSQPPLVPNKQYLSIFGENGNKLAIDEIYNNNYYSKLHDDYFIMRNINNSAIIKTSIDGNGSISSINIEDGGIDYVPETTTCIIKETDNGTNLTQASNPIINFSEGKVKQINITKIGNKYDIVPVTITGLCSNNHKETLTTIAYVNLSDYDNYGSIKKIVVPTKQNHKFSPLNLPNVSIASPSRPLDKGGVQATAIPIIKDGKISDFIIVISGSGYFPYFEVEGNLGKNFSGEPYFDISGGLSYIKIINHGYGFWETPDVIIRDTSTNNISAEVKAITTITTNVNGNYFSHESGQIQSLEIKHSGNGYNKNSTIIEINPKTVSNKTYGYILSGKSVIDVHIKEKGHYKFPP